MRFCLRVSVLFLACLSILTMGCGSDSMDPQGPEMGAVQKYLDEHPEERETAGAVSEEDEFTAAGSGT